MKFNKYIPEVMIAGLAALLRLPGVTSASLTLAESRILLFAGDSWDHLWKLFINGGDRHFGAAFTYVSLVKLTGAGLTVPRTASAVLGLLSLAAVYALVRRMFGGGAARVAALFFAVLPYHVIASRNLGPASAGIFSLLISLYFFHRIYEGETSLRNILGYIGAMIIGVNLHYTAAMLVIPVNVLFAGFARERKKNLFWWIPANVVIAAICALWAQKWAVTFFTPSSAATFAGEMAQQGVITSESFFNIKFHLLLIQKYLVFLYALGGFFGASGLLNGWSAAGVVLIPLVFHYLPLIGFREYEDGYRSRLFSFILLAGLLGTSSGLSFTSLPMWDYIPAAAALFYAVCANGAARFSSWRAKGAVALLMLCVLFGYIPTARREEGNRADWKRVVDVMEEDVNEGYALIVPDGWLAAPLIFHAPDLKARMFALMNNFDMKILEAGRYRQEEILPILGAAIDSYPPKGMVEIMATAGEVWVLLDLDPDRPENKLVHEYEMWLQGYAGVMDEIPIGGDVVLRKYALMGTPRRNPLDIR